MLVAVFSLQEYDFGTVLYVCLPEDNFDHGVLGRKKLGFAQIEDAKLEAALLKLPYPRRIDAPFSVIPENPAEKISLVKKVEVDGTDPIKLLSTLDSAKNSPVLSPSLAYLVSATKSTCLLSSLWNYFFGK